MCPVHTVPDLDSELFSFCMHGPDTDSLLDGTKGVNT
jgi:hypothetical protein